MRRKKTKREVTRARRVDEKHVAKEVIVNISEKKGGNNILIAGHGRLAVCLAVVDVTRSGGMNQRVYIYILGRAKKKKKDFFSSRKEYKQESQTHKQLHINLRATAEGGGNKFWTRK